MKKIGYLVFSIVLCVTLAACSNQTGKGEEKDSNTPPPATPTVTDTPNVPSIFYCIGKFDSKPCTS